MKPLLRVFTTTIIGGPIFLVPIVLTAHAMRLAGRALGPLASVIPAHSAAGVAHG